MCEICQNWPRGIAEDLRYLKLKSSAGLPLIPNHSPNCPRYNDSLIDVWLVKYCGSSYITDSELDAEARAEEVVRESGGDTVAVVKEKFHREVFENLPEFDGF